jgi:hypothetical protein
MLVVGVIATSEKFVVSVVDTVVTNKRTISYQNPATSLLADVSRTPEFQLSIISSIYFYLDRWHNVKCNN